MFTNETTNIIFTALFGTCNLLIGAMIGFVFSIATTYLSHKLQIQRFNQEREIKYKELQQEKRREILTKRMSEFEDYIKLLDNIVQLILDLELEIIVQSTLNNRNMVEINGLLSKSAHLYTSVLAVEDHEIAEKGLRETITLLVDLLQKEIDIGYKLYDRRMDKSFKKDQEQSRVQAFMLDYSTLKSKILTYLDNMTVSLFSPNY